MPDPDIGFWIKDAQPGRWEIKQLTIMATKLKRTQLQPYKYNLQFLRRIKH